MAKTQKEKQLNSGGLVPSHAAYPPLKDKKKEGKKEAADKLCRLEVICSQAMDEDFITACAEEGVANMFTKLPSVLGQGYSVPKMGDSVWPQLNSLYIIYCKKAEAEQIRSIVKKLQGLYPGEGCAVFSVKAQEL